MINLNVINTCPKHLSTLVYIDMDSITLKIGSQSQTGRAGSLETPPLKPGPGNWPAREKIVCRKRQFEEREGPRFAGKAVG